MFTLFNTPLFLCPLKTLIKVSRCEHTILEEAREAIQREMQEEIYEHLRKLKKSVMEPAQGTGSISSIGSLALRKKYVSMTAVEVVLEVFTKAEGVFSARLAKVGD